MIKLENYI